jgi:hypothetical protein
VFSSFAARMSEEKKPKIIQMMGAGANPKGWNDDYDPFKNKYNPIDDASWKRGEK